MTAWECKHTLIHIHIHTHTHTSQDCPGSVTALQQSCTMIDPQHCLTGMKQEHNFVHRVRFCCDLENVSRCQMDFDSAFPRLVLI